VLLLAAVVVVGLLPFNNAEPAVRLAATSIWSVWAVRSLATNSHELSAWLRERVATRGGDADPPQPVRVLTTFESNQRNAPMLLASLESARESFMEDPSRSSCHLLAIAASALAMTQLTVVVINDYGLATSIATGLCGSAAAATLSDLYRGRYRTRPWRTVEAAWPDAWRLAYPPSRVPGPVWLLLLVLLFAATLPISRAGSLGQGATLTIGLLAIAYALWAARHQADLIDAIERTATHRNLARLIVRLAPAAWHSALVLQVALTTLGVVLVGLAPIDASALYLGLLVLGMALIVRSVRSTWRRPTTPDVIDVDYLTFLLSEPHLKHRITRVAALLPIAVAVWTYLVMAA
jgi:hypothetical protein